jgi:hypothetical protein
MHWPLEIIDDLITTVARCLIIFCSFFLTDATEEEVALQRVAQAKVVAKQAIERAVGLRSRAQSLMVNAELATYKSVMTIRIAEAARASDSSRDLVLTILD